MKTYIKTVNANSTAVLADNIVPIGTTLVTGYNKSGIRLVGNSIIINDNCANGYEVIVNATMTVPVVGDVTLDVYQNGVAVVGGTATETFTTITTQGQNISFSTIIKSTSGCTNDIITLYNSGLAATFSNVEFDVIKL